MSKIETGGPAFPISIPGCGDNGAGGMTLRDYFATEVSPSLLKWMLEVSAAGKITADEVGQKAAEASYGFADAMIRARGGDRD